MPPESRRVHSGPNIFKMMGCVVVIANAWQKCLDSRGGVANGQDVVLTGGRSYRVIEALR